MGAWLTWYSFKIMASLWTKCYLSFFFMNYFKNLKTHILPVFKQYLFYSRWSDYYYSPFLLFVRFSCNILIKLFKPSSSTMTISALTVLMHYEIRMSRRRRIGSREEAMRRVLFSSPLSAAFCRRRLLYSLSLPHSPSLPFVL